MTESSTPRVTPCASCPYRKNVPSGVWDEEEYQKLPQYDGPISEQNMTPFGCHQSDGHLCSGWVAHTGDPLDLLAVRLGILTGNIDPLTVDYTTKVPLFGSGAEAAEHGMKEITAPGPKATKVIEKLIAKREL